MSTKGLSFLLVFVSLFTLYLYLSRVVPSQQVHAESRTVDSNINSCTLHFSDVPQYLSTSVTPPTVNAFYKPIKCLSCNQVIDGYQDGTFHPNEKVTRGQLAKMIAQSTHLDPSTDQIFVDVLRGSDFAEYINAVALAGYISGYQCGTGPVPNRTGCSTGKLYFYTEGFVTRGQISKVIVSAAKYNDTIAPNKQTFVDITNPALTPTPAPSTNTVFWKPIELAALHSIISGYQCGTGPVPNMTGCSSGKLYFNQSEPVTREQASKMIATAFFSSCLSTPDPTGGATVTPVPTNTGSTTTPVATPTIPQCDRSHGDANCDTKVDLKDYELWRNEAKEAQLLSHVNWSDFNKDNKVDVKDFSIWANEFSHSNAF